MVEWFQESDVVFLGRLTKFNSESYDLANFIVQKIWKGAKWIRIVMTSQYVNQFQLGGRYLVYAVGGLPRMGSQVCPRTRIANNVETEMVFLDKLAAGMEEKELFKWLLTTAQTHHVKKIRKQALDLVDSKLEVITSDIPDGVEGALKKMAEDPNFEHSQYVQTILDKIKRSRENRNFLP